VTAEGATLVGDCCNELEATDISFHLKGQDEVGKVKCSTDI
jgi:hypothetical protein